MYPNGIWVEKKYIVGVEKYKTKSFFLDYKKNNGNDGLLTDHGAPIEKGPVNWLHSRLICECISIQK